MSRMSDMMPMSLVAVLAPRRQNYFNMTSVFLKEEKICYKKWYITLCIYFKPIVRNRVTKLEFRETKKFEIAQNLSKHLLKWFGVEYKQNKEILKNSPLLFKEERGLALTGLKKFYNA